MNLATTYLGLPLSHPVMPGASPLVDDLDTVRRLEDAGAAAIVMHSLFAEQVEAEQLAAHRHMHVLEGDAEANGRRVDASVFALGVDAYLRQIRRIREAVSVPVIASLNGSSPGPWMDWARRMEEAGAHALELNLYALPTEPLDGASVEKMQCDIVREVVASVTVPVAVKLSPWYASLPGFVRALEGTGARGVVTFNRFFQADIDPERMELERSMHLSDRHELLLRLRWLAILSPQVKVSLGCSGGVHEPIDVVKAIMAGAHGVQTVSSLLQKGPGHLAKLIAGLRLWMEAHEFDSIDTMRGCMDHARCPDPSAYERANYVRLLQGWHASQR